MTIISKEGATMKNRFLIALAKLLVLLSATVCQASDSKCDTYRRVESQVFYDVDDEAYGGPIRMGNMRFHHISVEVCVGPKTIGNAAWSRFADETNGTSMKMGGIILYNVDW
jgi:hypothetical protein